MLSKSLVKQLRSLQLKKFRDAEKMFIVEGPKMFAELCNATNWSIKHVYSITEELIPKSISYDEFSIISEVELKQISALTTPNKILAVVHYQEQNNDEININSGFHLLLDGIRDPGNLGTIIRTADWFGINSIIASADTVDFYNPKVIQASMGSVFRVPISYQSIPNILEKNGREAKLPVYAAMLEGDSVYKSAIHKNSFLLMGNESFGVSSDIKDFVTNNICIPYGPSSENKAESLNVAIATSIICSEWSRRLLS